MKKLKLLLVIIIFSTNWCHAQLRVEKALTEDFFNPIGLGSIKPRFSWQLYSDKRNVMQIAYQIRVGKVPKMSTIKEILWNSGKIYNDSSVNVSYKGDSLKSGQKYYWQVRVWDNYGKCSDWGSVNFFQIGLLKINDWKAKWIESGYEEKTPQPSPVLRKQFPVKKRIISAIAYITAHGLYAARINGKRVGDAFFTPGWTSYNKRLQYQVYDVTSDVKEGENVIAVTLGNGWYRGNLINPYRRNIFGKTLGVLFQLVLKYSDGSTETVISDGSWKSFTGEIRFSEIYHGETIDYRLGNDGWLYPGYNDSKWSGVKVVDYSLDNLVASESEPVKKHETFKPVKILKTPKGEQVIDFGQNLVGWVIVKVTGKAGDTIKIGHAEVLDKAGNFYTENLRTAKSEDTYILSDDKPQVFEPHFTFHGFRYIKVTGYPGELKPEDFTAVAIYSDMKPTGSFTTSNPLVNQLQHNIQWGQKGNFVDLPTDCPQRDERLGWTGDAQVFSRTASFNMDVSHFFGKWLNDLAADQAANGWVPNVVPNVLGPSSGGAAGWGDAATVIPWNMYLAYGDKQQLEKRYSSMRNWVKYITNASPNYLWNKGYQFGDWLSYMVDNDLEGQSAITDKYLIAQCFFANSIQIMLNSAKVLDRKDDVDYYSSLLMNVKNAFLKEYVTPGGRLSSNTQTAYVLALQFDMLPESLRMQAVDRLVENIKNYNNHLSTGFLGTPYICQVLSRFGKSDVAYNLLLQKTFPSWLYPVTKGATSIWERWDGIRPDGSFEPASMNSFNHYAYGAIGDWLYREMIGIDNDEQSIGYKKIRIKPHISDIFSFANANYETRYGMVCAGWKIENGTLTITAEIPANCTASIYIPTANWDDVSENGKPLSTIKGIQNGGVEGNYLILNVGSGKYAFSTKWSTLKKSE